MPETGKNKETNYTWEIIGFNEDISRIPLLVMKNGVDNSFRLGVYAQIIGNGLVYRVFEIECQFETPTGRVFITRMIPTSEIARYVFTSAGLFVEKPDKTKRQITPDKIEVDDMYDAQFDADTYERRSLFREFLHKADIPCKNDVVQALNHVKDYPMLGLRPFIEIYSKVTDTNEIEGNVPPRILNELKTRNHPFDKAIRIDKDLVVVTGGIKCRYLDCVEQTRAYFDNERAYYFIQNAVTHKWQSNRNWRNSIRKDYFHPGQIIDKEVFDNTCAERIAEYSVEKCIPNGQRINYADLLAQFGFLSAEQAAKMGSPVYNVILRNICEGKICDGDKSLPEILGITGPQIKFLSEVLIPRDLDKFAECIKDIGFVTHFPDSQKRIFAVAFYLNACAPMYGKQRIEKEIVFEAAPTLSSLQKTERSKREILIDRYGDYLVMRQRYLGYLNGLGADTPLRDEILQYGDFPLNMKPSRISDYHRKIMQAMETISCSDQITRYSSDIHNRKIKEAEEVEYSNNKYSIIMPNDAEDIIREGRELNHCVGRAGYIGFMAEGGCRILFLRKKDDIQTPLLTIEEREGAIVQCYGENDSYNTDAAIRDFIIEYASHRGLQIDTKIYDGKQK